MPGGGGLGVQFAGGGEAGWEGGGRARGLEWLRAVLGAGRRWMGGRGARKGRGKLSSAVGLGMPANSWGSMALGMMTILDSATSAHSLATLATDGDGTIIFSAERWANF